jgi:hypothetical protein
VTVALPDHLEPVVRQLRSVFPTGVPEPEYLPLLVVMADDLGFSDENLSLVVAELVDGEPVVVDNDLAAALSRRRPPADDVARVRQRLHDGGLTAELPPD